MRLAGSTQYCPAGLATACAKVLVLAADSASNLADVQLTLRDTGAFAIVDTFAAQSAGNDGGAGTPSAALLAAYDAVLTYNCGEYPFGDTVLMGDRLAAYHDQGGGVVVAQAANVFERRLQGAYGAVDNGYALMDYATEGFTGSADSLGEVLEPQSPLMTGVASFSAEAAWRSTANVVAGRGVVVARWRNGNQPLVLRGTRGGRTLVELNFYPLSTRARWNLWTGDGGMLLRNALKYSRCKPCGMGTYVVAGGEEGCRC
jgi:hypothetical protein